MLAAGLIVGLAIGGAWSAGLWLGKGSGPDGGLAGLQELKLRAMASHGAETFAVATGPVDESVEGLFTLDFLTGDLQCFVFNPRTYQQGGIFRTNIAKDLAPEKGKKPSYLLVTGVISNTATYSNFKPAGCVCYVVDANTGECAAYTFPWAKAASGSNIPQAKEMTLIYKWKARSLELRE
jgi:hypothetical protein